MAQLAIECFKRQSYVHKELVIINHSKQPLDPQDDARIREIIVNKGPGETIGDLRNIGLQNARGDLVISWDDDDWHSPDRIAIQAKAQSGQGAVLLRRQMRINLLNMCGFCIDLENGIPNTILYPRLPFIKFESVIRDEYGGILKYFDSITVVDNDPMLHIQTYDGLNLTDADCMMQSFGNPKLLDRIEAPLAAESVLREIIEQYVRTSVVTTRDTTWARRRQEFVSGIH
jgi:glycosyltransferase involved in cell wall biosynthesis